MSQPKKLVPIESLEQLLKTLQLMHDSAKIGVDAVKSTGKPGIYMDGWPTLVRGLRYVRQQIEKVTGQANMPHIDLEALEGSIGKYDRTPDEMAKLAAEDAAEYQKKNPKKKPKS